MGEKQLYIRVRGKVTGPFGLQQLQSLRDRGQFRRFHEVSEDRQTWTTAAALTELFPPSAPPRPRAVEEPLVEAIPVSSPGPSAPPAAEQWFYVGADGQKQGPITHARLTNLCQRGIVRGETLVWGPSMPDWAPAQSVVGFPLAGPAEPIHQQAFARPMNPLAIAALVLAVLWLGGLGSIAAIVCGLLALRQIRQSQGTVAGWRVALAGVIVGAVLLVLTPAVALVVWDNPFAAVKVQRLSGTATAEEITAAYKHRVYRIETQTGTGSGILVANTRSRGLVATNLHVLSTKLENSPEQKRSATDLPKVTVQVKNPNQMNPKPARWAAFHRAFDLALLLIELEGERPGALPILRKKSLMQGEAAVALGNPLGLEFFTSTGAISSTSGEGGVIWMTCPISGGNSGGPLFLARKGKLVGINTLSLVHPTAQNLNGSVPAEEIVASLHLRQTDSWVWAPDLKEIVLELADMIPLEN
jgi:S1-C subfamily serine protease